MSKEIAFHFGPSSKYVRRSNWSSLHVHGLFVRSGHRMSTHRDRSWDADRDPLKWSDAKNVQLFVPYFSTKLFSISSSSVVHVVWRHRFRYWSEEPRLLLVLWSSPRSEPADGECWWPVCCAPLRPKPKSLVRVSSSPIHVSLAGSGETKESIEFHTRQNKFPCACSKNFESHLTRFSIKVNSVVSVRVLCAWQRGRCRTTM
mmetsp:Transcript_2345/g.5265  ORF Transcript_2345/g.5265 Transcript_2345/m.5265 type:complete len:202 (-) Transcript_2345:166-771(-)